MPPNFPTAPTTIAVVPCAFALLPSAKFQYNFTTFLMEVPPCLREIAVPLQERTSRPINMHYIILVIGINIHNDIARRFSPLCEGPQLAVGVQRTCVPEINNRALPSEPTDIIKRIMPHSVDKLRKPVIDFQL